MSTRRLIAVALACGLAILAAGTILLFTLSTSDDGNGRGSLAELGETAELDGATVGVLAAQRQGETLVLEVSFTGPVDEAAGLAERWLLVDPTTSNPRPKVTPPVGARPCPAAATSTTTGGSGAAGDDAVTITCDVAFDVGVDTAAPDYLAVYRGHDDQSFWRVPVTAT